MKTSHKKRFLIIYADPELGEEELRTGGKLLPDLNQMQRVVKGNIELVRVLREDILDETGRWAYTYMICNETGLLTGLPRNEKATQLYQANIRRQYPDSADPFAEADKAFSKKWESLGATVIDGNPPSMDRSDPPVTGDVLLFDGYTCEELQGMGF